MNQSIIIKQPNSKKKNPSHNSLPILSLFYAFYEHFTPTPIHLLAWMIDRSLEGTYQCLNGTKKNFKGKHGCTEREYRDAMELLIEKGMIKRMGDTTNGRFPVYRIKKELLVVKELKKGAVNVTFEMA